MCLRALTRIVKKVLPSSTLHIDAVMGDAEDAQLNGFQQVSPFDTSTYLVCFSRTLHVRKRTRYLSLEYRRSVMDCIVRIHYAENITCYTLKEEVLGSWDSIP
ncbi:hypothetical protein PHMEG_0009440 [Phytophthora megakarya]|uniref:Uncharacterized protein n=1 Tax=Phytophthora megakarya TaxID=4795 RepID=A0A225WG78_9STRA|nr:hypothetical protein PHMEG_0009440 [Phytophthora megakarya]